MRLGSRIGRNCYRRNPAKRDLLGNQVGLCDVQGSIEIVRGGDTKESES